MRIAVCSQDTDERHLISRLLDDTMPPKGLLPKISLFPLPHELLETTAQQPAAFDVILLSGHRDEAYLKHLCKLSPVILIGEQALCPTAFDVGAAYFIETPVDHHKLEKALTHCIQRSLSAGSAPRFANLYWRRC